jgi:HPt (histidine-containing phosphotransfer) domain-containing protein
MTADDAPVLDPGVIADLRAATGDDDEFISDLIETYVAEGNEYVAAMVAAVAADDIDALVRPAHTLKSSSASIGAMHLSELGRGIEEAAREGRFDGLAADVERVQAAWVATTEALVAAGLTR